MPITSARIPPYTFNLMVNILKDDAVDPRRMMAGSGLTLDELAKLDTRVSFQQALLLIHNAVSISPDPGLGLAVANQYSITDWGMFGYAIASCATIEEGLGIGLRYSSTSTSLTKHFVETSDTTIALKSDTLYPVGSLLPFFIEEDLGSIIHIMQHNLGASGTPAEVQFSYSEPSYSERYRQHFRCPIKFGCSVNQIIWDISVARRPLPSHNPAVIQHAIKLCEELIRDQEESSDLVDKVRARLLQSPGEFPPMCVIATELNMSESTLRRSLNALKNPYQKILDDTRAKMAIQYLTTSNLLLEDIAYLVGFADVSNFRRAFKKWTGKPPISFRKQMV